MRMLLRTPTAKSQSWRNGFFTSMRSRLATGLNREITRWTTVNRDEADMQAMADAYWTDDLALRLANEIRSALWEIGRSLSVQYVKDNDGKRIELRRLGNPDPRRVALTEPTNHISFRFRDYDETLDKVAENIGYWLANS